MEWIDATIEMPTIEGKYLVKTRTMMGNTHKVDSHCSINKKNNKASFNVSNQIVTHWLKED